MDTWWFVNYLTIITLDKQIGWQKEEMYCSVFENCCFSFSVYLANLNPNDYCNFYQNSTN